MIFENIKKIFRPIYVPLFEKIFFYRQRINFHKKKRLKRIKIMRTLSTIRYIKKNNVSISRYGDGEFGIILNKLDIGFQQRSDDLAQALRNVLSSENNRLLICLPRCMNYVYGMKSKANEFWHFYSINNYNDVSSLIYQSGKKNYVFGDTMLTRPYMDWKSRLSARIKFIALMSIWKNKDLLIVEGEQTRLGVGNDLFDNAKSIKRILAPAKNAFSQYSQIKKCVLNHYNGEIVLLALGPTATVLAADLSNNGIQALDIGHIDIEYMWYIMKAKEKIAIPNKFTNESFQKQIIDCTDDKYLSQIIMKII